MFEVVEVHESFHVHVFKLFEYSTLVSKDRFRLQRRSAPVGQVFQPNTRVFEATIGMMDKMDKKNNNSKNACSWSSPEVKFLVREFEVAQVI